MLGGIPLTSLISIIMPAYNCAGYLKSSVESVLRQTYPDWELLILDDASTDQTWALMQELAAMDPRIRISQNSRNSGVGRTRNNGVKLASGDWIAFLDSDDLWEPQKLEKQVRLLEQNPQAKLLFTGSAFITGDGSPIDYILHVPEQISRRTLLKQNLISCSSALAAKSFLLKYPMPEQANMHEDFAVWLQILGDVPAAFGIDEPLLIYRKSSASKSGNKWKAAVMNWNTYRFIGLPVITCIYYMIWYAIKGILKYRNL